jgi:hypothetical protein
MCACRRCTGPKDDVAGDAFPAAGLRDLKLSERDLPGLAFAVWRLGIEYRATDVVDGKLQVMAFR